MENQSETTQRIWLSPPHLGGNEKTLIAEALDSNWVAPVGPHIARFEEEIKTLTGAGWALALNSGTAAIQLGLRLLGVGQGSVVLCPTFNFMASVLPVLYAGAEPFLLGTDPNHWNTDPQHLLHAIDYLKTQGRKPAAFINVHLFGNPAPMQPLLTICQQHQIPVLDDAAEALGSTYQQKQCGNLGTRLGVLSFNGNKIITASGGGMLLGNHDDDFNQARYLANMARTPGVDYYEFAQVGYSMGMSNILAALGLAQLQYLPQRIQARRQVFNYYKTHLEPHGFVFQQNTPGAQPNHWLTCATLPTQPPGTARQIIDTLARHNIEARPLWRPLHLQPVLKNYTALHGGIAEQLEKTGICLPSGSNLTHHQQNKIIDLITTVLNSL